MSQGLFGLGLCPSRDLTARPLLPTGAYMKAGGRRLGAHSARSQAPWVLLLCPSVCSTRPPPGSIEARLGNHTPAGLATVWIRTSRSEADLELPECGLGHEPHHIDEQNEKNISSLPTLN